MATSPPRRGQAAGSMAAIMYHQRHRHIIDQLNAEQEVRVSAIAKALGVSEATIRRDLQVLERQGLLRCVHGGAAPINVSTILPLTVRKVLNKEEKDRIARYAATLLHGTQTVFFGGGTTMLALADHVTGEAPELCVTDMVDVALALGARGRRDVVLVGGHLDPVLRTLSGPSVLEQLGRYRFDAVLTSTNGLHTGAGLLDHDESTSCHRRFLSARTERHIILADHSKFGRKGRFETLPLSAATDVVTDRMPGPDYVKALQRAGVALHIAEGDG